MSMALALQNRVRGARAGARTTRRSKGLVGMPLGPFAEELSAALLVQDHRRALSVLLRAIEEDWTLVDVEELVIAPAVSRLGDLWIRGRLSDADFDQVGRLAERVEMSFRHRLVNRAHPGLRSTTAAARK